jgi:hypothetical protein
MCLFIFVHVIFVHIIFVNVYNLKKMTDHEKYLIVPHVPH